MIANTQSSTAKKRAKARAGKKKQTVKPDYVMVTFGRSEAKVKRDFDKKVTETGMSASALGREMIRAYLGYPTHLP
jgi:hypothetical protein